MIHLSIALGRLINFSALRNIKTLEMWKRMMLEVAQPQLLHRNDGYKYSKDEKKYKCESSFEKQS